MSSSGSSTNPSSETPGGDNIMDSTEIASLNGQLANAKVEIEEWKAQYERNAPAAKLQAEKSELEIENESLRKELKSSPESLTARIKGLNDLTNNLNAYLKLYCMEANKELKDELENTKTTLSGKIQTLEDQLSKKESEHEEKVLVLNSDFEKLSKEMAEKIETLKSNFAQEKEILEKRNLEQIDEIKKDLEKHEGQTSTAEEAFQKFKIEAHEK